MNTLSKVRTCIGCGEKSSKMQLLRVVRSSDGSVFFDKTGRAAGRGAYVCSIECLNNAVKKQKFNRALKTKVSQEEYGRLSAEIVATLRDSEA